MMPPASTTDSNSSLRAVLLFLAFFSSISSAQTVSSPAHLVYTKDRSATRSVSAPAGNFVLWVNPEHWREVRRESDPAFANHVVVYLETTDSGAGAMWLAGEAPDSRSVSQGDNYNGVYRALFRTGKTDPKERVVVEKPIVNGHELLCMTYDSQINNRPAVTYGCSYVGRTAGLMLLAYCAKDVFEKNQPVLKELVSGLEMPEEAPPTPSVSKATGPQLLMLNNGRIKLTYDGDKWTKGPDDDKGRIWFDHRLGNAFAFVLADLSRRSSDEVANLRVANSNQPRVLLRENRKVNGTAVCFMILSNRGEEQEFTSYGYYYGGKAGTFELVVATSSDKIRERENDFMELLNGLQISPGNGPVSETPYEALLEKLKAGDMSIDFQALRYAYATSSSFVTEMNLVTLRRAMFQAVTAKEYTQAVKLAEELLNKVYVQPEPHLVLDWAYTALGDSSRARFHHDVAQKLIRSILDSGDGATPQSAMTVVSIAEEHAVMNALGLLPGMQATMPTGGHQYDSWNVVDSRTGKARKIYFNVDRFFGRS